MTKYHGIDWDLVEKRVEALDSFKEWIAENEKADARIEFDKGEPVLRVNCKIDDDFLKKYMPT